MDYGASGPSKVIWDGGILSGETTDIKPVGRQKQIIGLTVCLSPMRQGQSPINAWLHGPPGSGKTLVARWTVEEICSSDTRVGVYVNCGQHKSLYTVLHAIINQRKILDAEAQHPDIKLDKIRQAFRGRPAVIILDQIDRPMPAQREDIIRGLLDLPNTGLVCIANDTRALAALDDGVRSRLSPTLVEMPAYSSKKIEGILQDRACRALAPDSWSEPVLKRIAASAGGDARWAIQALRRAAVTAEETASRRIDVRVVKEIARQHTAIRTESRLASLSEHERIIWDLAKGHASVTATDLARAYVAHCGEHGIQPMARRTFSKHFNRLVSTGVLEVTGRTHGVGGRIVRAA